MKKSLLFLITIAIGLTFGAKEEVRSLCDDPEIHSADRLPDNEVRVYRGNYYWKLTGLPDRVAKVYGPFKIKNKYMGPTTQDTSIMTVLSGPMKGNTWKFKGNRMWQWDTNGNIVVGGKGGVTWNEPVGGFDCAMNDGDYDKKGSTRMIALNALKAYYWRTDTTSFEKVGEAQDTLNGYLYGRFGELFPIDATACMTFPMDTAEAKYYVYIFQRDRYCFRPITGEDTCKEWRKNTELFNCETKESGRETSSSSDGSVTTNPKDSSKPKPPKDSDSLPTKAPKSKPKPSGVSVNSVFQNSLLLLVLFSILILQ